MSDVTGGDFLAQNDLLRIGLTEDDYESIHEYADHHAGGLLVLWRPVTDQLSVKAHDSWGGRMGGGTGGGRRYVEPD